MSGFEPIVAEAVVAEAGTAALASEVMAPELLAATAGSTGGASGLAGISGLFGTGLEGAAANATAGGMSGLAGIGGLFGSGLEGLAANGGLGTLAQSAAPTMVQQLASANPVALGQIQEAVLPSLTPDQLAQITGGIPAAGPGVQVAELSSGMGGATPEMLDPSTVLPAETPFTPPPMPGAMTGAPTPLPSSITEKSAFASLMDKSKYLTKAKDWWDKQDDEDKLLYGAGAGLGLMALNRKKKPVPGESPYSGPLSQYGFDPSTYRAQQLAQPDPYRARYAGGGPIEEMSNANAIGANTGYPMVNIGQGAYATPYQQPISRNVITDASDTGVDPITGEMTFAFGGLAGGANPMSGRPLFKSARNAAPAATAFSVPMASAPVARPTAYRAQYAMPVATQAPAARVARYTPRYAEGGISDLGGYSDGGRMLKGPGDGMSDNIPATIAGKQPARLANEEFVIPADVVSHLGNGSSDAGAKQLYKMMDRVRQARTGKKKQGKQIKAEKYMPA